LGSLSLTQTPTERSSRRLTLENRSTLCRDPTGSKGRPLYIAARGVHVGRAAGGARLLASGRGATSEAWPILSDRNPIGSLLHYYYCVKI
jgi:hypothetical protein